jgi:hypothetical protein
VTLTTAGQPPTAQYAKMGRLVRASSRPDCGRPQCTATQRSLVQTNTVLSAGNSAFGGIVAEPLQNSSGNATNPSFAGASVNGNVLWTSPRTWFQAEGGCSAPGGGTGAEQTVVGGVRCCGSFGESALTQS